MAKVGNETKVGKWAPKFNLGNVAIHLHLLPTGEVLYWGRRDDPTSMFFPTLNEHFTHVYILNLDTLKSRRTKTNPVNEDGMPVNLFCAGHTFQPDGTLIVFGGHVLDGFGEDQTCVYDPFADDWTALPSMVQGRWYPTAITLPDGRALVASGSSQDVVTPVINIVPQIWNPAKGAYDIAMTPNMDIFALWPRFYHVPDGRIFSAGPLARSRFLDLTKNQGAGAWSDDDESPVREAGQREYAGSAMYDKGRIIYVSGGGGDNVPPSNIAETINLNAKTPGWKRTSDITYGRRHHFATTLADGTVLVTGGSKGLGFNDLSDGKPVHTPELWDPATGKWTVMAPEDDDRCYHHTAILLPDGKILSAGGGEYAPDNMGIPNEPRDSYITAQIFSPPYLFKGPIPTVSGAPKNIDYKQEFKVQVGETDEIGKVSWTRLASVTHTHNMNQSFQFLDFKVNGTELTITGPDNPFIAPAGYYMLFLISKAGVPSNAPIILLNPSIPIEIPQPKLPKNADIPCHWGLTLQMKQQALVDERSTPPVVIGITPTCPYGLGPCWGGAFEALNEIKDIDKVQPRPDQVNSVAFAYLHDDIIPDFASWEGQFHKIDGGTYTLRGLEITLTGTVAVKDSKLVFTHKASNTEVALKQFTAKSKLEWDNSNKVPKPVTQSEAMAYTDLYRTVTAVDYDKEKTLEVTGRLNKDKDAVSLDVRSFK